MTDEHLFALANAVPLLGWLALALAPLARGKLVAAARVVAVVLAVGYAVMVGAALVTSGGSLPDLSTLPGLARAFSDPHVMLIGWIHYLALDLWTGAWEAEEAGRRGIPHWLLLPCLAFTFLAGPVGLLLFLGPTDRMASACRVNRRLSDRPSGNDPAVVPPIHEGVLALRNGVRAGEHRRRARQGGSSRTWRRPERVSGCGIRSLPLLPAMDGRCGSTGRDAGVAGSGARFPTA